MTTSEEGLPVLVEEEELTGDIETLKQKIEEVADDIYHLDIETQTRRGNIKKKIDQIYKLSQKNNVTIDELRQMIVQTFERAGIDPSTMRKVMPEPLKKLEKTNKRYLDQTPELIAEQFRREEQQQEGEEQDTQVYLEDTQQQQPLQQIQEEPKQTLTPIQKLEREVSDLKREVVFWKTKAQRYQERFTARATLSSTSQEVPVIVQVNALEKTVEHIEIDTGSMREEYEAKPPRPPKKI